MTVAILTRTNALPVAQSRGRVQPATRPIRSEGSPAKPDERLWKTDKDEAFEAGVRWFLAVSRVA